MEETRERRKLLSNLMYDKLANAQVCVPLPSRTRTVSYLNEVWACADSARCFSGAREGADDGASPVDSCDAIGAARHDTPLHAGPNASSGSAGGGGGQSSKQSRSA